MPRSINQKEDLNSPSPFSTFNPEKFQARYNDDIFRSKELHFDLRGEKETPKDLKDKESGIVYIQKEQSTSQNLRILLEKKTKELDSYVFHPSTQGTDTLVLTFQFPVQVYVHCHIVERGQPTPRKIGRKLYIEEIKWKFANPIQETFISAAKHVKLIEDPTEYQENLLSWEEKLVTRILL